MGLDLKKEEKTVARTHSLDHVRNIGIMAHIDAMGAAGVVQDALGSGGLAGIDVSHDANVAYMIQ